MRSMSDVVSDAIDGIDGKRREMGEQSLTVKSVPLPRPSWRVARYDWLSLVEIGDSFFIPGDDDGTIARVASAEGKASGRRYQTRKRKDGAEWGKEYAGVRGVAVWRIG